MKITKSIIVICALIVTDVQSADTERKSAANYLDDLSVGSARIISFLKGLEKPLSFLSEYGVQIYDFEAKFESRVKSYIKEHENLWEKATNVLREREELCGVMEVVCEAFWKYDIEGGIIVVKKTPNRTFLPAFRPCFDPYKSVLESLEDLNRAFWMFDQELTNYQKILDNFKQAMTRLRQEEIPKTKKDKVLENLMIFHITLCEKQIPSLTKMRGNLQVFEAAFEVEKQSVYEAKMVQEAIKKSRSYRCAIL
ncbi:MAG: hypothetical protein OXC30_03215 [Alphaproteobacteria bacterium]|nr:hypothetical protein [Alphaproteobacteria bacterium]